MVEGCSHELLGDIGFEQGERIPGVLVVKAVDLRRQHRLGDFPMMSGVILTGSTILCLGPQNGVQSGLTYHCFKRASESVEVGVKVLVASRLLLWSEGIVSVF